VAPEACQFGKYETFTRTGVPSRETWKLMVLSVWRVSDTCVVGTDRLGGAVSPIGTRGHDAGPLWARKTLQRAGSSYQLSEGGSHYDCAALIPTSTAGSLGNGSTTGDRRTR